MYQPITDSLIKQLSTKLVADWSLQNGDQLFYLDPCILLKGECIFIICCNMYLINDTELINQSTIKCPSIFCYSHSFDDCILSNFIPFNICIVRTDRALSRCYHGLKCFKKFSTKAVSKNIASKVLFADPLQDVPKMLLIVDAKIHSIRRVFVDLFPVLILTIENRMT